MKYEFSSRFRNRIKNPEFGKFKIESSQITSKATTALDPVCLSAPMISWTGAFNQSGIIYQYSVLDSRSTEILVSFGVPVPIQAQTFDFLAGCILSSATLNLRILGSKALTSQILSLTCPQVDALVLGQVVNIQDYTTFNPLNIRAPTNYDVGQFSILYNETRNEYLKIANCDLDTRRLTLTQSTAPGWFPTDNLNIRDAPPLEIRGITASTTNTVTTTIPVTTQKGNWIRMRLSNYLTQAASDSWSAQIVNIFGNVITFFPPQPAPPSILATFEILEFSFDNAYSVQLHEPSKDSYFDVELETLCVPNIPIFNGDLRSIPYLLVELKSDGYSLANQHLINTNNPFVSESVWIAKLDNSLTQDRRYLRFNATNTVQRAQRLFLNNYDPFCLTVRLPNGRVLESLVADSVAPAQSFQDLNLCAIFNFEEVSN